MIPPACYTTSLQRLHVQFWTLVKENAQVFKWYQTVCSLNLFICVCQALVSCLELLEDENVETRVCGCKALACLKVSLFLSCVIFLVNNQGQTLRFLPKFSSFYIFTLDFQRTGLSPVLDWYLQHYFESRLFL